MKEEIKPSARLPTCFCQRYNIYIMSRLKHQQLLQRINSVRQGGNIVALCGLFDKQAGSGRSVEAAQLAKLLAAGCSL